ncbi:MULTISPECIES: chemotaxis protein CheC [unclassified Janthinobacterium]|uniref:chemotaxis protein CheC n=1 Tax=unclassified Janthinobacterium TaxID=2610881 RepID=UPI00161E3FFE|nr:MULTISPECIES: chemotaxis protein CheC [unclassified Janthinobacterium]MBB5367428.1 chemotaxis protein CheC [Janthinobacterium sp. K2C7]MBB5380094.1 chemotaxis protein CheC [Janthinobacterium sp. K2Li3]MBB5385810.1 chemotaxis protein CheC [Janthinobacterium sp. K2E3]
MVNLSELENDALVEIFNIGVGHAAAAMSEIVNEEVTMSVPSITFLNRADAAALLGSKKDGERICGVSQHYDGAFATEAILMFPEDKSLEIVRLMVGDSVPLQELTEMEQEAMSEIGNIILNSCVGTLANLFDSELHGSLPLYHVGTSAQIMSSFGGPDDAVVLMLHIDFVLAKHQIHGYVAFVLDLSALHDLKEQVSRYLAKALGQA